MLFVVFDDQWHLASAAKRPIVEPVFGHAVFCAAIQAADDHIIEWGMTFAACGLFLEPAAGYPVFRTAVEAPDNHFVFFHDNPSTFLSIFSYREMNVNGF
jgi:hypothetical protein